MKSPRLDGVREGVLRKTGEENKELLNLLAGIIYLRVGAKFFDDHVRLMGIVLRGEMQGMAVMSTRQAALAALRQHCPVMDPKFIHITETWVPGSPRQGAVQRACLHLPLCCERTPHSVL